MWDLDKVITEGLKLVALNEYALGAQPWTCFASNYSNSEYIYGMENAATNNPGSTPPWLPSIKGECWSPSAPLSGGIPTG
jgi:hypothetical protein